jgi:hypothetical protein
MIVAHRWKLAFGAVVLVVAGVLSWVTVRTLGLERSERAAAGEARFQERLRLVLWRMDSALTPIIAREAARPYFEYRPFHPVDARRSASPDAGRAAGQPAPVQTVMVPSPLLNVPDGGVLLHFEQASTGRLSSPQAPEGEDLTAAKGAFATPYGIAVAEERLRSLRQWFTSPADEASPPLMANVQAAAGAVPPSEAVAEYNASCPPMQNPIAPTFLGDTASSRRRSCRSACVRRSGVVSTRKTTSSASTRIDERRRLSRGSSDRQTTQSHATNGTPWEVPVPRKVTASSAMT